MEAVRVNAQRAYHRLTQPVSDVLIRAGTTPNTITTIGAVVLVLSAIAFGLGAIRLGGGLLIFSGVIDTLDGQVARSSGQASRFGAFFDSTLDRLGDGVTFMGIALFLLTAEGIRWPVAGAAICMLAIISAMLVSYARARAEGLGLECKVGLVQRAERILLIGLPALVVGAGPEGLVLLTVVGLLALGSSITVVQRFVHVHRITAADRGGAG